MTGSKKKQVLSTEQKRRLVEPENPELSIVEQCALLSLARSSFYHQPAKESVFNLRLMRLIDEQYMKQPSWGVPRITSWLRQAHGLQVNRKRVARLMKTMGLRGLHPRFRPRTSSQAESAPVFPYLLRGLSIERTDQVWVSDITYIPMAQGFMYLVAIMDLFSRYVLSWEVSNSLDAQFCLDALDEALQTGTPSVFNTDKGSQYTSKAFVSKLREAKIQPSMTGTGRCHDNIHVERLWWSVKYEDVYLKEYLDVPSLYEGLKSYFRQYNSTRPHRALNMKTPKMVYLGL